jgi:hypothetical protein
MATQSDGHVPSFASLLQTEYGDVDVPQVVIVATKLSTLFLELKFLCRINGIIVCVVVMGMVPSSSLVCLNV